MQPNVAVWRVFFHSKPALFEEGCTFLRFDEKRADSASEKQLYA